MMLCERRWDHRFLNQYHVFHVCSCLEMICHLCLCITDTSALDQSVDVCVLNYMIVGKCVLLVERYGLQPLLGLRQEVHLGLLLYWLSLVIPFSPNTMLGIDGKGKCPCLGDESFLW